MSTPISSSIPFCTAARLRDFHDFRTLGDTILDTGARETTEANFDSSTKVLSALMRATGRIEAAALKGERYTAADLQALTGAGQAYLEEICGELAWWILWRRRYPKAEMEPATLLAFQDLEDLGTGKLIFGLQENAEAGIPDHDFMTESDFCDLGLASDQASRMFGVRAKHTRASYGNSCDCG